MFRVLWFMSVVLFGGYVKTTIDKAPYNNTCDVGKYCKYCDYWYDSMNECN